MKLTGKAEELFIPFVEQIYSYEDFIDLPDPMKWGVYVDFFREVLKFNEFLFFHKLYSIMIQEPVFTPREARTAAIKKANKIVNNR